LVEGAHQGRMLRDHRGQGQGARPARGARRSQRGALHDGERQGRNQGNNDQLLRLCSLRSEPFCASVSIPKFASPCGTPACELRNQRDTSKLMTLVWFLDLKFL